MNTPVFSVSVSTRNDNYFGWINKVIAHPACPAYVKAMKTDPSAGLCSLAFEVCLTKLRAYQVAAVSDCHLRNLPEKLIATKPCVLSMGGIKVAGEDYPARVGYINPPGEMDNDRVTKSWVADAVSFQHTPSKSAGIGSKAITVDPETEKELRMSQQTFESDIPPEMTHQAVVNSDAMYQMLVTTPRFEMVKLSAQISSAWVEKSFRPLKTAIPASLDHLAMKQDNAVGLPTMKQCKQPPGALKSEVFYTYLDKHRKIRGADKKGVSALTSGYYLFSMSRAMDQVLWQVIDILTVYRVATKSRPAYLAVAKKDVNANVIGILALNGVKIKIITTAPSRSESTKVTYVIAPERTDMVYVPSFFSLTAPTVSKKGLIGQTESEFIDFMKEFMGRKQFMLTHVYLRDYMAPYTQHMFPSVHCHAGHVMLTNANVNATVTISEHFARMTMANKYKTAFPVRRVPFSALDKFRPEVLDHGIILNALAYEEQNVAVFSDEYYDSIDVPIDDIQHPVQYVSKIMPAVPSKPAYNSDDLGNILKTMFPADNLTVTSEAPEYQCDEKEEKIDNDDQGPIIEDDEYSDEY